MTIHLLPPEVAAKIAAGEVVERPASVVKELLENSIDAEASEIRVEMREGGRRLLRVVDNGYGMTEADAPLAFLRHATSKLRSASDLERIASFGFRGEALYSIAAVSQLTLVTRQRSQEFAVQLRLEGGEIVSQQRAGAPVGTLITVEHLFFNTPARLKFLRSAVAEAGQIASLVQRYALAHPHRRFSLVNEGKLVFQSTGSGDALDVLVKLMGPEDARQMVRLGEQDNPQVSTPADLSQDVDFMSVGDEGNESARSASGESAPLASSPVRISGFASLPTLTRGNRSGIDLFVNRRAIEDRSLTHAVVQAYHTLLPVGRFPVAVVLVELDPSLVDVNVHPQKSQVRFADERRVYGAVQKAVRRALVDRLGVQNMALDQTGSLRPTSPEEGAGGQRSETWNSGEWQERRAAILAAGQQHTFDLHTPAQAVTKRAEWVESTPAAAPTTIQPEAAATRSVALSPRPAQLPPLRVVGQIGAAYIVCEGPDSMYLIDQHAAHERILYEHFMAQRYGAGGGELDGGGVARQHLLTPLTLHTGSETAGLVARHLAELERVGFEIEPFGGDTFLVRAVPGILAGEDPLHSLQDIVSSLATGRNLVNEEFEARLVKMVCKRAAIKAGQLLSDIEMQELVRQLEECQSPRTCPHGRPTMIQLSAGELEKAFGRV